MLIISLCVRYSFSSFRNCVRKVVEITSLLGEFDSCDDENVVMHFHVNTFVFVFALHKCPCASQEQW